MKKNKKSPKILFLDCETSPLLSWHWSLWDQNISLGQIVKEWHLLSFAAKWHGSNKIIYHDQRGVKNVENDKKLLQKAWNLLNDADIVIWQNGKKFDFKKLNARFILNGMKPPSSFRQIDTKQIASRYFAFTSNKLEWLSEKLNKKYKKMKSGGFQLWIDCMAGKKKAWTQMKKYNIFDVLALEELWEILAPWDNSINFNVYTDSNDLTCSCGSTKFKKNGFAYLASRKVQRYVCQSCGREHRGGTVPNEVKEPKKNKNWRTE